MMLHRLQLQHCPLVERHWCSERPSLSVWVAVEVTVAGVSQSHSESDPQTGFSVCAPMEQVAMAATEPLGGTGRLFLEPVLLAVSFFGLAARSIFCLSGRLSSEPADFAAVLLAASVFGMRPGNCRLGSRIWSRVR